MKLSHRLHAALMLAAIVTASVLAGIQYGIVASIAAAWLIVTPLSLTRRGQCLGAIGTELKISTILDFALRGFNEAILPLRAFSTVFNDQPLSGNDKITVPYYPIEAAATRDYAGTYVLDAESEEGREITINKRKYQSLGYSSSQFRRQPAWNPEENGFMKGFKLGTDIVADVLSVVTAANYGAAAFTGAASTFDSVDVADIRQACQIAKWPPMGRSLIIGPTYETGLLKDSTIKASPSMAITEDAMRRGQVPEILGFKLYTSNIIPANAENLVGMAVYNSAILIAFSPIEPAPEVRNVMTRYERVVDSESNLTLEYREWGDPLTDSVRRVIEANYGFAKGEGAAIKRMVSA